MDDGCLDKVEEHLAIGYVDGDHNKVQDENARVL
jgi:hypothetical protein